MEIDKKLYIELLKDIDYLEIEKEFPVVPNLSDLNNYMYIKRDRYGKYNIAFKEGKYKFHSVFTGIEPPAICIYSINSIKSAAYINYNILYNTYVKIIKNGKKYTYKELIEENKDKLIMKQLKHFINTLNPKEILILRDLINYDEED